MQCFHITLSLLHAMVNKIINDIQQTNYQLQLTIANKIYLRITSLPVTLNCLTSNGSSMLRKLVNLAVAYSEPSQTSWIKLELFN